MAQVTVQRYAAELGRLPPTCICCGQPAQQMVRHKFFYDPLWLIILGPILGIFRYLWSSQSLVIFAPVCPRHGWRLGLPTYIGYGFAASLLVIAPLLIFASQAQVMRGAAEGYIWLSVFLYVLGMLALLLAVRVATPRLVDFDTGSVTFGSVSLGFKAAITGQALPGQGLRSVGLPGQGFPSQSVPTQSAAYAPGLRSPATDNGPLFALMGIGGGLVVLVFLGLVVMGAFYINRARRNAEFRRLQADAVAAQEKARADAEANHQRLMAEHQANLRRAASAPARSSTPSSSPNKTTGTLPTITSPSSTLPTSNSPTHTTPTKPIAPATPPLPPQTISTSSPATTDTSPILPDSDPFGIGQQIGPPGTFSAGGIPPKPRPDLEAKADPPIRGRFDKPGPEAGPDGQVEVVYRPQGGDPPYPSTSKPPKRVTDLKLGMEIWIQDGFRQWYRGTVTGIDGLRAMVHKYGSDPINDELVPIPRIRLAGDVQQPVADGRNPFEDPAPQRKRTWTDSTGKFTILAEFVKLASGKVTLKREDGSEISLPLEMLTAADQQIAKQLGK